MRFRAFLLLVAILLVCLNVGCGGNCNTGTTSSATVTITSDWTQRAQLGNAQSQRIQLLDSNGLLAASLIFNQDASITVKSFAALPVGSYHLQAQLFSLRDAGGTQLGTIDQFLTLSNDTNLKVSVGSTAASVQITPTSASLVQLRTQQFYANLLDAAGNLSYLTTQSVTWSALGGIATISTDGVLTANSPGTGSVRASVSGLANPAAAPFTITTASVPRSKWTILVFLNAANDLDSFSAPNVIQMQKAAGNSQVRFVLQWKQALLPETSPTPSFIGTRRYLVTPDSTSSSVTSQLIQDLGPNVDMGSAQTLSDFVSWGRQNFPSDRVGVVIWNHGNGWRSRQVKGPATTRGASYDDSTGNHIDTWQLAPALGISGPIDFLAWDASLMQMAEVAYEVKDVAKFMVGSEQSPPGAGYPYDLIFAQFRDNPDADTATLCRSFVDGMLTQYTSNGTHITQSVLDLSKMPALATATKQLAQDLIANQASIAALVQSVRSKAPAYPPGDTLRTYRDLGTTAQLLGANSALSQSASAVQGAVSSAVLYERHGNDSAGSTGLAIDFSTAGNFGTVSADYAKLKWAADTGWNHWLLVAP